MRSCVRIYLTASMAMMVVLSFLTVAEAALVSSGNVVPGNPSSWTLDVPAVIGNTANGSVTVNGGSQLLADTGTLGNNSNVTGTVSIDGVGSKWTTNHELYVGNSGIGNLSITNGGELANGFNSYIANNAGSTGTVTVDGAGSTWSHGSQFLNVGYRGDGTLNVTNGATLDAGSFTYAYVGYFGGSTGHMSVTNGSTLKTAFITTIGTFEGSTGFMTIDNSTWNSNNSIIVGSSGTGTLNILNGAKVNSAVSGSTQIGNNPGEPTGRGAVVVNGAGSTLNNPTVFIGLEGTGTLSVSDGGTVNTTGGLNLNNRNHPGSTSMMTVDVGRGSSVNVGNNFVNNATVRFVAGTGAANGTYTPITAANWLGGSGAFQAVGGVYDATNHTVTVSSAATGQAGVAKQIDLSTTQRMLITDAGSGKQVGASFQAAIAPANLILTASLMNNSQLSLLQGLLDPGKAILSGWNFSATGYTPGDPVYLSLQVGGGQKLYDLDIWHFDGTSWGKYLNTDLAYDNTFASFVANGFSGYAVSGVAAVPVPAALWLFGSGLAAMAGFARRNMQNRGV